MYLEFNVRLLFCLLFLRVDCYGAIDLDTIIPNYLASNIRHKKRTYDAHEFFTELKEIVTRPRVQKVWLQVEKFALPRFPNGYTVNDFLATEFKKRYGVNYAIVRNLPQLNLTTALPGSRDSFIIYQGAVNEGRSFETLIPAMKQVNARLVVCGNGNFFNQVQQLIKENRVADKVELRGMVPPEELKLLTPKARAAVMLFEDNGLNQFQSLSNRFFDYIMAGVPQICIDYPQYRNINDQYQIAFLIPDTQPATIASALNKLLFDDVYYNKLRDNCILARQELNWQKEEQVLLDFYKKVFDAA